MEQTGASAEVGTDRGGDLTEPQREGDADATFVGVTFPEAGGGVVGGAFEARRCRKVKMIRVLSLRSRDRRGLVMVLQQHHRRILEQHAALIFRFTFAFVSFGNLSVAWMGCGRRGNRR
jgi:hypothetical protein